MVPRSKYNLNNAKLLKVPRDTYLMYHAKFGDRWAEQARYVLDMATEVFE